jgi:two-component system LytT family sensor kinase
MIRKKSFQQLPMRLHDFIFSEQPGKRLQRHLLFWLVWWLYFSLCDYLYQQPIPGLLIKPVFINVGSNIVVKFLLLVFLYTIACYTILYYVMPMIIKKRRLPAALLIISLAGFLYGAAYVLFWNVFPFIDYILGSSVELKTGTRFWPAIYLGLITPLKVIAVAVAIKYVKGWWLKQKENERLNREKINAELQLLKAQVHPDFLFKTLNNIYTHSLSSSPQTPGMLLKLSDLLSYMLYDCDKQVVPLDKEVEMMKEYMQLEKIRHDDKPEMELNIRGELHGKYIPPFLLLPFIENSFKHSSQVTEQSWINMDIRMNDQDFSMKLTNGLSGEINPGSFRTNGLANVQKRLTLLYPGRHKLKINTEQEMLIVQLTIRLQENNSIKDENTEFDLTETENQNEILPEVKYVIN